MKKTLLTIIGTVLAVSAMATGAINVGNSFSPTFRAPIYADNPSDDSVSQTGQSSLGIPTGSTVYGGAIAAGRSVCYAAVRWAVERDRSDVAHVRYQRNVPYSHRKRVALQD